MICFIPPSPLIFSLCHDTATPEFFSMSVAQCIRLSFFFIWFVCWQAVRQGLVAGDTEGCGRGFEGAPMKLKVNRQWKVSFIYLFIYLLIHSFIHSFIHLSVHPFIHLFTANEGSLNKMILYGKNKIPETRGTGIPLCPPKEGTPRTGTLVGELVGQRWQCH